jgi:SAM-dependent methyltransferase
MKRLKPSKCYRNKSKTCQKNPVHATPESLCWIIRRLENLIIKPKADGFRQQIKHGSYILDAEFVPDMNIYLVFDVINPPEYLPDDIAKYKWLHRLHPYFDGTNDMVNNIHELNTLDDIYKIAKKEDCALRKFLSSETKINWFPKAVIIPKISEKDFLRFLNIFPDFFYQTDGWIFEVFGQSRFPLIKYKPKKLMTLDLLFDGTLWLTSDNMQMTVSHDCDVGPGIWRCFWKDGWITNKSEKRHEKTFPNPYYVALDLESYHMSPWNPEDFIDCWEPIYYHRKSIKITPEVKKYISIKTDILDNVFSHMLDTKTNMFPLLDLGCGKGISYYYLKDNFGRIPREQIKITGIDYDASLIWETKNKIKDKNTEWIWGDLNDKLWNPRKSIKCIPKFTPYKMVLLHHSAHYIKDWESFVNTLNHLVDANSHMVITFTDLDKFPPTDLPNGMTIKHIEDNDYEYTCPWLIKPTIETVLSGEKMKQMTEKMGWNFVYEFPPSNIFTTLIFKKDGTRA